MCCLNSRHCRLVFITIINFVSFVKNLLIRVFIKGLTGNGVSDGGWELTPQETIDLVGATWTVEGGPAPTYVIHDLLGQV